VVFLAGLGYCATYSNAVSGWGLVIYFFSGVGLPSGKILFVSDLVPDWGSSRLVGLQLLLAT